MAADASGSCSAVRPAISFILSWRFCSPLPTWLCRERQIAKLGFLLGRQGFLRFADHLGLLGRLGGLLHRLLVLLEQLLGILDDAAIGFELTQAVEHFLELVGDRLLIRLGLGQLGLGGFSAGLFLVAGWRGRLRFAGGLLAGGVLILGLLGRGIAGFRGSCLARRILGLIAGLGLRLPGRLRAPITFRLCRFACAAAAGSITFFDVGADSNRCIASDF